MQEYTIQNQKISLALKEGVFIPTAHGIALANLIKINKGESVLDLGTGSGLLAILASKLGGVVTAVDILSDSVEQAKQNAIDNNVDVNVLHGDLFEPVVGRKFDVIIANIPQEIVSKTVMSSMSDENIVGVSGGLDGNNILLNVLKNALECMHENTRLYILVNLLSDFRTSFEYIVDKYSATILDFYTHELKDFFYKDIEYYKSLYDSGVINYQKKNDKYYSSVFVIELKKK